MSLCGETIILQPLTVYSNKKNLPVTIRGTNKPLCLVEVFCLGVPHSLQSFVKLKPDKKTEAISMFGNFSAVHLLLWLTALFFTQIEGKNPVSSNSSKVSLLIYRTKTWLLYLACAFPACAKKTHLLFRH